MYKSLKTWMNLPVQIKPFLRYDGVGDKIYSNIVTLFCYAEGKAVLVKNADGSQVVSQRQLYFNGNVSIKFNDTVIFEGKEYEVQATSPYYRNAKRDILVVYV